MATSAQTSFVDPFDNSSLASSAYQNAASQESNYWHASGNEYFTGESGLVGFFRKLVGEDLDMAKAIRQTEANQAYERSSIESARAWSEYMDNTQYQRRVKDIEAAGLNPWLAVQSGLAGTGAPSVDTGGTAQNTHSSKENSGEQFIRTMLGIVLGLMAKNPKVAAALIGSPSSFNTNRYTLGSNRSVSRGYGNTQYDRALKSLGY